MISTDMGSFSFCQWIPLIICVLVFLAIVIYVIVDYEGAMRLLNSIVEYIKEHPYQAMGIVILCSILLVIFIFPITFFIILVAYAYCKAFESFGTGFALAVTVLFVGFMLGALIALVLGRFLFADFINNIIQKS